MPSALGAGPQPGALVTISRHIMEHERRFPAATGEFSNLLTQICLAAKIIHREVTRAGLVDLIGAVGRENATGDVQQKLDVFAHEIIFRALDHTGQLCAVASEESEDVLPVPDYHPRGKYVVNFDPLDGSSNIDVGVSIGTTFSILRRLAVDGDGPGTTADCMQAGKYQVCAGYVMYGSSTVLVYSAGHGVHHFIFDPSVGEFILVNDDVVMPKRGSIYSVNEGNAHSWDDGVRRYVEWLKDTDKTTGRPYRLRYVGTLVADFHRTLFKGGIFLYPADRTNPRGKLRYLYEAAPIAYLAEQAGGTASDGRRRILDIEPETLHERTPLIVGSAEDVRIAHEFIQGKR